MSAAAYNKFVKTRRPLLAQEQPDLSMLDLAQIVYNEWVALPDAVKQVR